MPPRPAPKTDTGSKPAQILAAAKEVFLGQGFGAASMDAIARAAGVSKATLYAHFSGKEDLFAAIVGGECRRHAERLACADIGALDVREALHRIGRNFLDLLLSPEALGAFRVVVAESPRFPELGRAFYEAGPALVLGRVAEFLREATSRGLLAVPEPEAAADHFLGMLKSDLHLRVLLCLADRPPDAEIDAHVRRVVELFVRAFAASGGA